MIKNVLTSDRKSLKLQCKGHWMKLQLSISNTNQIYYSFFFVHIDTENRVKNCFISAQ